VIDSKLRQLTFGRAFVLVWPPQSQHIHLCVHVSLQSLVTNLGGKVRIWSWPPTRFGSVVLGKRWLAPFLSFCLCHYLQLRPCMCRHLFCKGPGAQCTKVGPADWFVAGQRHQLCRSPLVHRLRTGRRGRCQLTRPFSFAFLICRAGLGGRDQPVLHQ